MGGRRGILDIQNRGRAHESRIGEVNDKGKGRTLMGKVYSMLEGFVKDMNSVLMPLALGVAARSHISK